MNIDNTQFTELTSCLMECDFVEPLSDALRSLEQGLAENTLPRRNVYLLGNKWVVKYYFAGAQRIFFTSYEILDACRVADMIIYRFADLRRSKHRLADQHFNFTPEQAKRDVETEHEISSLLLQMKGLAPDPKAGVKPAYGSMRNQLADIKKELSELRATVKLL